MLTLKDNKIVKVIFEITLFIMLLPITTIILKSLFAVGQLIGTYTRVIGL